MHLMTTLTATEGRAKRVGPAFAASAATAAEAGGSAARPHAVEQQQTKTYRRRATLSHDLPLALSRRLVRLWTTGHSRTTAIRNDSWPRWACRVSSWVCA